MTETLFKLTVSDLRSLAAALRTERIPMPPSIISLKGLVPNEHASNVCQLLECLFQQGFCARQATTLIDFVVAERLRALTVEDALQLVTSGPEPGELASRNTSVVVRDLFTEACHSVIVVGYAVYQGQTVFQALAERMAALPSLRVRLFLDIQRRAGDTTDSALIANQFVHRFKKKEWPIDKPLPKVYYYPRSLEQTSEKRSCLHAKCVVVDETKVFLSSANFTEAAQERNIELGVLVDSKELAIKITSHFDTLLSNGFLSALI